MQRKLVALLSADVHGYSRLMGEDEAATVRTLTGHREVMSALIREHRGRVVDSPGDNLLAEFSSAVDALTCAVAIQQALANRNLDLPDGRRMWFRIGINLGDVITDGERLYGDGVNIAARVQDLADPGGVCISGTTYDQVEGKLALTYEFLGEQRVKNIAKPVRLYRVLTPDGQNPAAEPAGVLDAPGKPSLAVLPFANMSADPDQEYFSDGIAEDLITDLSKLSGLLVIARNSTFVYKGRPVRVQQVGRELGVRYVLEGSVRKAGDRVRITAQLVDAGTGHHLWADRYDRRLDDVFAVQDEITGRIVESLAVALTQRERAQREHRRTDIPEAYDWILRGLDRRLQATQDANLEAGRMFEQAIELDPGYAEAHALRSLTHFRDWSMGWSQDPRTLDRAREAAERALALDPNLATAHRALGLVLLWTKEHERSLVAAKRSVALAPSDADCHWTVAEVLTWWRPEEAIAPVETAMRLNPHYPAIYLYTLGHAYYLTRRYEDAIRALQRVTSRNPDWFPAHVILLATYAELGRPEDTRREGREILRISPGITMAFASSRLPYKDPAMLARAVEAFRAAGLREP
jgi:adenylate cyclase